MNSRSSRPPVLDRFSTGLTIGFISALLFAYFIDNDISEAVEKNYVELAGVLAALTAACLALFGVQRQIRIEHDRAEMVRISNLSAAKAVLPLVLSELCQICESCFDISLSTEAEIHSVGLRESHLEKSNLNQNNFEIIKDCIRFSSEQSAAWLSLIAVKYQICRSRHSSMVSGKFMLFENNQIEMALDWVELCALTNHCFEFARGISSEIPISVDKDGITMFVGSAKAGTPVYNKTSSELAKFRSDLGQARIEDFQL